MRWFWLMLLGLLPLLALQGPSEYANAYPGLTVGLDMNPTSTTDTNGDGGYESVNLALIEDCVAKSNGNFFSVDIVVLDVTDLNLFTVDLEYDQNILSITATNVLRFLDTGPSGTVVDVSDGITAPGKYNTQAFLDSTPLAGVSGSGVLARLTVQAIGSGVSPFNIHVAPQLSRGVTLADAGNPIVWMGDTNADTFFDGPFINANGFVAVDAPDGDGDTQPDACDNDADGDGFDNGVDNCPTINNPTQSNIDGDTMGDPCDVYDADGDGYPNSYETTYGSNTLNAASRPEVCDGTDNDADGTTDEGFDYAAGGGPDCTQAGLDTDLDGTANTTDTDDDNDGFTDVEEVILGTDSLKKCHNGAGLPDWPADFDDNRTINIFDLVVLTPPFFGSALNQGNTILTYSRRIDLSPGSGPAYTINIFDMNRVIPPTFGTFYTPAQCP